MLHTDPSTVGVALQFMVWGVLGVFVVLGIFFVVIKALIKLFPEKRSDN